MNNTGDCNEIKTEFDDIEIDEKEISSISGGTANYLMTRMKCSSCSKENLWKGNFLNQVFDCGRCKKHTFKGVELIR